MRVTINLPPVATSPHDARAHVHDTLEVWGCTQALDVADLIVSELVTNAVEHAGTEITLSLELRPPHVRLLVTDHGSGRPAPPPPCPSSERGRGLAIVDTLAQGWGCVDATDGKTVWVDLPAS